MLRSLVIRNFVLIADAELELGPGLTALTGETGAGKTLLTQALELLLGERASDDLIGPSGEEALIQALFEVDEAQLALFPPETVELARLDTGELIATRRLARGGRNRCFLNDVGVTLASLGSTLRPLLAFSGQHEHRRLLEPTYQRSVVDSFAGREAAGLLSAYRTAWEEAREARRRLDDAAGLEGERQRERTLLEFQLHELEEAELSLEEEEALLMEERRLSRAEEILTILAEAGSLLRSEDESVDAVSLVGRGSRLLDAVADVDAELAQSRDSLGEASHLLEETARTLRQYSEGVAIDPARLAEVDQRLRTYLDLGRKYGGKTADALAYLESARERLDRLEHETEDLGALESRGRLAAEEAVKWAEELHRCRAAAAHELQESVERELDVLEMADTAFVVSVTKTGEWSGADWESPEWRRLGPDGGDEVDFQMAPNPGLPLRSLRKTASGGELSRTLLAIKAALIGLESSETLVFDEVDAGIGGRTATAVGAKLHALSRENQLLVITHLAQVAAFADQHILIEKGPRGQQGVTATRLLSLDAAASLGELRRMMGGRPGDEGALEHARRLRDRAAAGLID